MTWSVMESDEGIMHVVPDKDEREHGLTKRCWCRPTLEGAVWVHHAADKRELREKQ